MTEKSDKIVKPNQTHHKHEGDKKDMDKHHSDHHNSDSKNTSHNHKNSEWFGRRRRRNVSNKRCADSTLFDASLLATKNPTELTTSEPESTDKRYVVDNTGLSSILQAVQVSPMDMRNNNRFYNLFQEMTSPSNLIHGNIPSSAQSFESTESVNRPQLLPPKPVIGPTPFMTTFYEATLREQKNPEITNEKDEKIFPVIPRDPDLGVNRDSKIITVFPTDNSGNKNLPGIPPNKKDNKIITVFPRDRTKTVSSPPPCTCDREQIQNILTQMQSIHGRYNQNMVSLFNLLMQELNCGRIYDSFSSNSQPQMEINNPASYNTNSMSLLCDDEYSLSADPELALKCRNAGFRDSSSLVVQPPQTYSQNPNQFLSYQDYVRSMTNTNINPNTLMMATPEGFEEFHDDNPILGSSMDSNEKTVRDLKQFIDDYKLGEPEPEPEPVEQNKIELKSQIRELIQPLFQKLKARKS